MAASLLRTVRYLHGRGIRVTALGPIVEYEGEFLNLLARAMPKGRTAEMDRFRLRELGTVDRRLATLIRPTGASYFSMHDAECPGGRCALLAPDGVPLHFDYGHFTLSGAQYVLRTMPSP